jgi:hypothetical protein
VSDHRLVLSTRCPRRYEKWTGEPQQQREKTDDQFMDEYMLAMDRVQDLNLVSLSCPAATGPPPPGINATPVQMQPRALAGNPAKVCTIQAGCCAVQKAEEIAQEKNRALKAAMNAELRKSKAFLLEDAVPKLEKLVKKGKGLTTERIQDRLQKVGPEGWGFLVVAVRLPGYHGSGR